ncbi:C39 family peptidase, partial [Patescibacteria group bacterium]|nr:C39 family peptidase [Patescibacteria group bacterium]
KPIIQLNQSILHNVPFTSQAPLAEWNNDIFQYGCEEASLLMAMHWVEEKPLSVEKARAEILAMAEFQNKKNGSFYDTSAADTAQLMRDYFNYQDIKVQQNIDTDDIKTELFRGNLVIVPVNGRIVRNPFFTSPPLAHMFVVVGYDADTKEFIVNDPGTQHGQTFRYAENVLNAGLQDYPTGRGEPITEVHKVMIVVKPLAI